MLDTYFERIRPQYSGYQELHVHTEGSFRDAVNTVSDVFDAAEELGRKAVAITDHGNWTRLFAALKERTKREKKILETELAVAGAGQEDIKQALKAMGPFDSVREPNEKMVPFVEKYEDAYVNTAHKAIQFIPGVEMYEAAPVEGDTHRWHIIFYAKDWQGAKALFLLCNLAQLNKHNDLPRCTTETMRLFLGEGAPGHGHVIATSACIGGKIPATLLKPYYNSQAQQELCEKKESLTQIPEETLWDAEDSILALTDSIAEKKAAYAQKKKQANRKFTATLKRAQTAIDKALTKSGGVETDAVAAARANLASLQVEIALADQCRTELPALEREIAALKESLKEKKTALEELEKQNRPAERIQEKIDELAEEAKGFGDVFAQAKAFAQEYEAILGKGNFFLELQDHGLPTEFLTRQQIIRISKETGIPLTAANDVHYKNPEMKRRRDIAAALRFPNLTVDDVANQQGNDQLYFKSNAQMEEMFRDVPEALEGPARIAAMCNVVYHKAMHLPEFKDEGGLAPDVYLRKMAIGNISRRYPDYDSWEDSRKKSFMDRIEYELGIIDKMGYSSYIDIVEDFINYSKRNFGDESIGPGRGSGAGSLVCYLVGITNIDPLRYDLIFERFLNPERVSMPDIDTDLSPEHRDKVIEYVAQRYAYKGDYPVEELRGTVCSIVTEGVLAAKSAIRQVGKVTGVSLFDCDRIAKLVPAVPNMTLKKAMEENDRLKALYDTDPQAKRLLDDAMLAEGLPVQTGVHAAGVIIADKPVSEYAPLFWNESKNVWVIQYDMVACESDIGLLKMDFLGLKNIDIAMRAKKFIRQTKGVNIDFASINKADDPEVISAIYAKGDTDGVFQFESGGMKKTLKSFAPKTIDDVILLNAAYRPGPMQYIPQVTDVKFGRKKANYIVPQMKSILGNTYGSPIYQEQIQKIFHEIAGFSLGEADIIRRAMSKKHLDELVAAKDKFTEGIRKRGAKENDIAAFWDQLLEFASYAFNKSHAAAYSVMSYYTAWLKHYYPAEFMASLLSYSIKDDIAKYVADAKGYGITVLAPDVNRSIVYTAPTKNGEIRIGLEGLKDVSVAADKLVKERKARGPYKDLRDLILRCTLIGVGKSPLESLAKSGALDGILKAESRSRRQMVENLPEYISECRKRIKAELKADETVASLLEKNAEQANTRLYTLISSDTAFVLTDEVKLDEYDDSELLKLEKDYAGYYVSGSPVEKYADLIANQGAKPIAEISEAAEAVVLAGYISDFKELQTKKDKKAMCRFLLEDTTGTIEVICFAYAYARFAPQMGEGTLVCLKGSVKQKNSDENPDSEPEFEFVVNSARKLLA